MEALGDNYDLSHVVHCNWDLDAERGYAYKQWFTTVKPSETHDLDEF